MGPRLEDDVIRQVEMSYSAGDFRLSRQLALEALAERPDDVRLLRFAGRSSMELDLDEALPYLRKAVELAPQDPEAWRDMAVALINAGDTADAAEALRQVVRLRPNETAALIDLAHLVYAQKRAEEAISLLRRVLDLHPDNLPALRSLIEMYREAGNLQAALTTAEEITRHLPGDIVAKLDSADLNLALGNFTAAAADYAQLRGMVTEPQHVTYSYHGMIHVELQRSNWRRALDHAIEATRVDRDDLTTQLLAFTAERLFGDAGRPTLPQAEIEAALAAEHLEHRRQHVEAWASQ